MKASLRNDRLQARSLGQDVATQERTPLSTLQMVTLSAFWFGSAVWLYVFVLLLVPQEIEAIVGGNDPNLAAIDQQQVRSQAKGVALGVTLLCGALVATIAAPVVGAASDRCDTRQQVTCGLGRRAPWLIAGVSSACLAAVALYFSSRSYWMYTASFALLQLCMGIGASPFTGLLSDVVVPGERGSMSGIVGACLALGNLFGAVLGAMRPYTGRIGIYALCMGTVVLSTAVTVVAVWDMRRRRRGERFGAAWGFGAAASGGAMPRQEEAEGDDRDPTLPPSLNEPAGEDENGWIEPTIDEELEAGLASLQGLGLAAEGGAAEEQEEKAQRREMEKGGYTTSETAETGSRKRDVAAGAAGRAASSRQSQTSQPQDYPADTLPVKQTASLRKERSDLKSSPRPGYSPLGSFFSAFADSDFFWAFWSRVSIQMGIFTVQEYLLLYLQFAVRLPSGLPPSQALSAAMMPLLLAALVAPLLVGSISDKAGGQRRAMLYLAGGTMVGVAVGLAFCKTWALLLPLAGLFGLGYGAFSALDLALALDVLPSAESHSARDLGLWNLALAAPLCVAAPIAGVLLDWGNARLGQNKGFVLLFAVAAVYLAIGVGFLTKLSPRIK